MNNMINWFTDHLVRALSLLTPSYFSDESLVATIAKLRAKAADESLKHGVIVTTKGEDSKKTKVFESEAGVRLYPHESSEMRKDTLIFKFRYDDITQKTGELYACVTVEIDSEGKVLKSESTL